VSDTKKTSNKTSSGRSDIVDLTSSIGKDIWKIYKRGIYSNIVQSLRVEKYLSTSLLHKLSSRDSSILKM
jgi:hypothetical protein